MDRIVLKNDIEEVSISYAWSIIIITFNTLIDTSILQTWFNII